MKQLLTILLIGFTTTSFSQDKISFYTPPSSPEASFTQQWVTGEIKIEYSRPLARGRKIFGGLVPFDSLWRTGASGATTIDLSEEIIMHYLPYRERKNGQLSLMLIPHCTELLDMTTKKMYTASKYKR
jgi:hypothetical protein